jgi:hypothetical protein
MICSAKRSNGIIDVFYKTDNLIQHHYGEICQFSFSAKHEFGD